MGEYMIINSEVMSEQLPLRVDLLRRLFCSHKSIINRVIVRRVSDNDEGCLRVCRSCGRYWGSRNDTRYFDEGYHKSDSVNILKRLTNRGVSDG